MYLVVLFLLAFVSASLQAGQTQIGFSCKIPEDCGTNVVCSEKSHICKCFYSYTPESDNINCRPQSCATESDCTTRHGAHSICNTGKTCQCDIHSGWTFDMETLNSCLPMKVLLNQPCTNQTDCSSFAFCDLKVDQPKCKCKFGFKPDPKSEINCALIDSCQSDDCAKSDPRAQCNPKLAFPCYCNYADGYKQDFEQNRCVPRSQTIGQNCSKNSKIGCGANAVCDLSTSDNTKTTTGACKCLLGFVPKSNQMDCTQLHCTSDAQCAQLNPNSKCYIESQRCICKLDYKYDIDRQVCVYSSAGRLTNFYSIQLVFVFVILKIFIF